jgi:hypothetical protein
MDGQGEQSEGWQEKVEDDTLERPGGELSGQSYGGHQGGHQSGHIRDESPVQSRLALQGQPRGWRPPGRPSERTY